MIIAFVAVQVLAGVMLFGARTSYAWFGTGSCPMQGGTFNPGQKCLAVDANGVEVPWRGEIILPKGTTSITDHALYNGSTPIAGKYRLELVEDNGGCCSIYQTIDYTVSSTGVTNPATFALNAAILDQAFNHHPVAGGNGGLIGYFLAIDMTNPLPANATCQNTVSFIGAGGALGSGTSPAGEKCNNPTAAIAGHIIDCTSGVPAAGDIVPAGTIAISGPATAGAAPNPVSYPFVPAGQYTETATPPSGYHFVYDCANTQGLPSHGTATQASETVNVPAMGSAAGYFYVARESGTLVAHIIDCTGGTPAASDIVPAGTAAVTAGPVTEAAKPAPAQWAVPTGSYTVTATAPANFHFVACADVPSASNVHPGIQVLPGGEGATTFYVARDTGHLAAHIYDCTGTVVGTTDVVPAGSVLATGPTMVPAQANPMSQAVDSGEYTVKATAPAGFHLVACNGQLADATRSHVIVPANGSAEVIWYVTRDTGSLSGVILDCTSGKTSPGSLAAVGPTLVPSLTSTPSTVMTGSYTVTASVPAGTKVVDKDCKPAPSTQTVTVPVNGTEAVVFYTKTPPPPSTGGTQGVSTGVTPGNFTGSPIREGVAAASGQAPQQSVKGAGTTQPNTGRGALLRDALLSLVLLLVGATVVVLSRERTARA